MMESFWVWGGPPNPVHYQRQELGLSMLVAELLHGLGQETEFHFSSAFPAARWRQIRWKKEQLSGTKVHEDAGSSPHILKRLVPSPTAA